MVCPAQNEFWKDECRSEEGKPEVNECLPTSGSIGPTRQNKSLASSPRVSMLRSLNTIANYEGTVKIVC